VGLKPTVVGVVVGLGLALGASAPASAGSGGAFASMPATITAVSCVAGCAGVDAAQPGSVVRVRGKRMGEVTKVVFLGAAGAADDVVVKVSKKRRTSSVDVRVPAGALSGPLLALNGDGAASAPSGTAVSIQRGASGKGPLDVKVVGRQVFYAAVRQARVDVLAREPMSATVALIRLSDGALVAAWPLGPLAPGVVRTVTWDGAVGGLPQPAGRYEFRVFGEGGTVQAAQAPDAPGPAALPPIATAVFDLMDHKFPVRGKHSFGSGMAAFGAGRNGHSHQGHDVFADCGTPLVAARGGVVKLNQHDENGGYYVVIDGAGTDVDYAYMHLKAESPLKKGTPVMTGQSIGQVGDTGDAVGCHLHFEMWTAPGWYTGGAPVDPLPALTAWDAYS
jgi:murein DD-endopeptidase MepM/ murein hydrolase activator NlpD